uniref:Uncharacterized protein n=1 Tax=Ditylenchus dipsaci TaxID=166011 RepID=A0A915DGE8_9BILA
MQEENALESISGGLTSSSIGFTVRTWLTRSSALSKVDVSILIRLGQDSSVAGKLLKNLTLLATKRGSCSGAAAIQESAASESLICAFPPIHSAINSIRGIVKPPLVVICSWSKPGLLLLLLWFGNEGRLLRHMLFGSIHKCMELV